MPRKAPLNVTALWQLQRISGLAASPDGAHAVVTVTSYDMHENQGKSHLWLLPTAATKPRQLTQCGKKDAQAAWSPAGDCIAFVAKREQEDAKDDTPQLYLIDVEGGEARRISTFAPGVEAFKWMPDGKHIVFIAWVWPELRGAAAQNKQFKKLNERKETGYATSEGQYRYFDHNLPQGRVPHLMQLNVQTGRVQDLFEGSNFELPREDPGAAHFDISPDGQRIAFTCDLQTPKLANHRLAIVEFRLKQRRFKALTDAPDWDFGGPRYSPDGRTLAMTASHSVRHHTALNQLALLQGDGTWQAFGDGQRLDVSAPLRWAKDGSSIYFTAEDHGRCHLWRYELASQNLDIAHCGGSVQGFDIGGTAGHDVVLTATDSAHAPVQIHAQRGTSPARRLEKFNDAVLARHSLGRVEAVEVIGALGDPVQMWLTYPPDFNPKKKYPVMQVIHGGPYTAAGDTFAYRWNSHVLASEGHIVAQVNYHGSSGFGFAFRHSIMGHMGELELQDLEAASDWLLKQRWADPKRLYATGGSYGGYLVAWMNGHIAPGRYRAYVCHAGVFDRVATWSADSYTQRPMDLGATYWSDMQKVLAQSPATFAAHMRTPTLVIHGAQDYRVPDHNGLAYYNTLKSLGVDARLLWFPDENHWILKPRNSQQWYAEFFAWLKRHV